MQRWGQAGGPEHAQQLRVMVGAKAARSWCGTSWNPWASQTALPVRTRSLTLPGVNGVEPEPVACPEASKELEQAARLVQLDYIRLARQAERNWHEIGDTLDLHWTASANKESIVVEAYDYAQRLEGRGASDRRPFTWTCPACQHTISDHGPYGDPPEQQEGHTADCPQWTAEVTDWEERDSGR